MAVCVLDKHLRPLMPCTEKRARLLLERGRARVHRVKPFVIRLDNRPKPAGWLAPSLRHRVDTTMGEIARLGRWAPVSALAMELVRFDMQAIEDPGISGTAYQQGTLAGYEIREYVLEKWGRHCAYCGESGIPLEVDRIEARSKGGSDRPSNLTLACVPCNRDKGAQNIRDFVTIPKRLAYILSHAKAPLRDAAAVNSTRWALFNALKATGLQVAVGTGGRTKWNRHRLGVPKTHALDAASVGVVEALAGWEKSTMLIDAMGRGSYCRTRVDKHGFPRGYPPRTKDVRGFRTGDLVKAVVPAGKKAGTWTGRVAVRTTGSFNIQTGGITIQGISHRHCRRMQRADGRRYATRPKASRVRRATTFLPDLKVGVSSGGFR